VHNAPSDDTSSTTSQVRRHLRPAHPRSRGAGQGQVYPHSRWGAHRDREGRRGGQGVARHQGCSRGERAHGGRSQGAGRHLGRAAVRAAKLTNKQIQTLAGFFYRGLPGASRRSRAARLSGGVCLPRPRWRGMATFSGGSGSEPRFRHGVMMVLRTPMQGRTGLGRSARFWGEAGGGE